LLKLNKDVATVRFNSHCRPLFDMQRCVNMNAQEVFIFCASSKMDLEVSTFRCSPITLMQATDLANHNLAVLNAQRTKSSKHDSRNEVRGMNCTMSFHPSFVELHLAEFVPSYHILHCLSHSYSATITPYGLVEHKRPV